MKVHILHNQFHLKHVTKSRTKTRQCKSKNRIIKNHKIVIVTDKMQDMNTKADLMKFQYIENLVHAYKLNESVT